MNFIVTKVKNEKTFCFGSSLGKCKEMRQTRLAIYDQDHKFQMTEAFQTVHISRKKSCNPKDKKTFLL